jgi:tetratricopeptide (TPR) repeat protein
MNWRRSIFVLGAALAAAASAPAQTLDEARKLYNLTQFDQSLKVLHAIQDKDAAVYQLMGRDYYMQADYKKATESLEKAVAADPTSAECALWLGRAYGRRAETSSPFTAPGYATKARQYFEKATQLNPRYLEALSDLFEYYLEAPGFLGGGYEKAQATASHIAELDAAEGASSAAKLAEKHKELGSAEAQLRRALELSPKQIGRFIDLARLLAKQGRFQESDQSLARARNLAPDSPKLTFAEADIYIRTNRNLDRARELLKQYLTMSISPDDPPKSQAEKLLHQTRGI